jgi:predicted nucleic acid-binding protein
LIYFDTDVLINFIVIQDEKKHIESQDIVFEALKSDELCLSFLTLQEMLYVLQKLGVKKDVIHTNYLFFKEYANAVLTKEIFDRAYQIADQIGFQNINDCIHTALAERYCQKLITYNKDDFKKIQTLSNLKISIF